jgi:hypothetical protein
MRTLVTIACLVGSTAALGLAYWTHVGVTMIGFPDGHVTDYGKAIHAPLELLAWAEAGLGLLFLALAVAPICHRIRAVGLLAIVVALVGAASIVQLGVPWYFGTHLGLDNGIGG